MLHSTVSFIYNPGAKRQGHLLISFTELKDGYQRFKKIKLPSYIRATYPFLGKDNLLNEFTYKYNIDQYPVICVLPCL